MTKPNHINSAEWEQALALARHECAKAFENSKKPADVLKHYGICSESRMVNWATAINAIAFIHCSAIKYAA